MLHFSILIAQPDRTAVIGLIPVAVLPYPRNDLTVDPGGHVDGADIILADRTGDFATAVRGKNMFLAVVTGLNGYSCTADSFAFAICHGDCRRTFFNGGRKLP